MSLDQPGNAAAGVHDAVWSGWKATQDINYVSLVRASFDPSAVSQAEDSVLISTVDRLAGRHFRLSDRDREAACGLLTQACAANMIDGEELASRTTAALEARVVSDLDEPLAGLPLPGEPDTKLAHVIQSTTRSGHAPASPTCK